MLLKIQLLTIQLTQRICYFFLSSELQQRLKEEKEQKRCQLDKRHNYIIQIVADTFGLDKAEVEDGILDGNQVSNKGIPSLPLLDHESGALTTEPSPLPLSWHYWWTVNPFTAPACTISELKSAHIHARKQYI